LIRIFIIAVWGPSGLRTADIDETFDSMLFVIPVASTFLLAPTVGAVSLRLGRTCPAPFRFSVILLVYLSTCLSTTPLKSPLCAHSPNFTSNTYTRTENLPFFKSVPYQDYNEGLALIPDLAFSSLLFFLMRICHVALDSR
jgi:hypothetical protein